MGCFSPLVWAIADLDRRLDEGRAYVGRITLICLLVGLGLAHHRMTALALPAGRLPLAHPRPAASAAGMAGLGDGAVSAAGAVRLYSTARAAMGVRDLNGGLCKYAAGVSRSRLGAAVRRFLCAEPVGRAFSAMDAGRLVWQETGGAAFVLGVIGLAQLWTAAGARSRTWVFVLLLLLANAAFAISYQVADREVLHPRLLGLCALRRRRRGYGALAAA